MQTQPLWLRRLRRYTFLLLLLAAAALVWRPDWRQAAFAVGAPLLKRAAAPLGKWVPWLRPEAPPSPPAPPPAPVAAETPKPDAAPPASEAAPEAPPDSSPGEGVEIPPKETPAPGEEEPVRPGGNLPPKLPPILAPPPLPASLRSLQAQAQARPSAAAYRKLADAAGTAGFTDVAATAYLKEAEIYRRLGDPNAAAVEALKAGRYRAEGRLYLHAREGPPAQPVARLEPPYGALLGAFIDRDDQLSTTFMDQNWQTHRDPEEFAQKTGKKHASLFCYLQYGQPFPSQWAERLRDKGVIPHLAWEPRSLAEVKDDATLARFADQLAQFDSPVFLRFAGEMNGEWTPYHGNPALYRQKFRLVYRVISRRAPKTALIWCVNNIPDATIDAYYPGDDAVDWVGVNFYNVLYFDNDAKRPAERVHPADLLQPVYARYAARKPIAICEYAASHQASVDPRPRPEVAVSRMAELYGALPRLFPRVKLVDWFDCNNLRHARPDRQLNDFSLTDDASILKAYGETVKPSYFLGSREDTPDERIRPLAEGELISGVVTLSGWARSHLDRPRVYLLADDEVLYAGDTPGPPVCRWDTRQAKPGAHEIRLLVLDREGHKILEERRKVRVAPQKASEDGDGKAQQ